MEEKGLGHGSEAGPPPERMTMEMMTTTIRMMPGRELAEGGGGGAGERGTEGVLCMIVKSKNDGDRHTDARCSCCDGNENGVT